MSELERDTNDLLDVAARLANMLGMPFRDAAITFYAGLALGAMNGKIETADLIKNLEAVLDRAKQGVK